jgi:hypothetical protein|nr:MAG TPA: antirepressor protein [Caudoviricetes sp.]
MKELVFSNNGQIVTNSLLVAEKFGKNHRDVLESINELVKGLSNTKKGSAENSATLFVESTYIHPQNKQTYRMYIMNRDGFSLLVMGFTGQRALEFKIDFIEAFNEYERKAKSSAPALPTTYKEALQSLLIEVENNERLQAQNDLQRIELQKQAPKVAYYEDVLTSKSTYNANQIAKELGMSAVTLNKRLHELKVQYKQGGQWLLYHHHQDKGYTKTVTHTYTDSQGETRTSSSTVWTEKGREFIHSIIQ